MKRYVHASIDCPDNEHLAIITFERVSVHDYYGESPSISNYPVYTVYDNKQEWEAEITKLQIAKEQFIPLTANRVSVTTHVKVQIKR